MKKVYAVQNLLNAGHVRNLLAQSGIKCEIRNYYLGSGVGDLPVNECWPEIWVDESDVLRAEEIILEMQTAPDISARPPWYCVRCGESNEDQFDECWHCGALRQETLLTP